MKAVYFERYGGSEVLRYGDWPVPSCGENEILIDVHAASVNPRDWLIREGRYFAKPLLPRLPFVLGSDVAGVVDEVGQCVQDFELGDAVMAMKPSIDGFGGYAETVAVRALAVAKKPPSMSFAEAAALPLAGLTALQALRDDARLRPQQKVLVVGASGGVGTYAVQIARCFGAAVTGVCSARNADLVRELGAERIVDYQAAPFQEQLAGTSFDVVFDTIGRESLESCAGLLTPQGVYVTTVPNVSNALASLRSRLLSRKGQRSVMVLVRASGADLELLATWAEEGRLRSVIDLALPLAEVALVHDHSRTFRSRGKNILLIR